MAVDDTEAVADDDLVHRRVLHRPGEMVQFDENRGRWLPLAAAIRFDPDLSVSVESRLSARGLTADDVAASRDGALAFGCRVGTVRAIAFGVTATPVEPPLTMLDECHGSVWQDEQWDRSEFKSRRNRLRVALRQTGGPPLERGLNLS